MVLAIFVIAFVAAGLAVVPALELTNADSDVQLLKNSKDKKPKKHADFTIDEPVIKLVKNEKDKKPKKRN